MINVFIVEDHKVVREGFNSILGGFKDILVVGQAGDGKEAIDKISRMDVAPDIVLMDLNLPVLDGMKATKILVKKYNNLRVIALTMVVQSSYIRKVLTAGAAGYILKSSNREELYKAIKTVMEGDNYFCKDVTNAVMDEMVRVKKSAKGGKIELTERERQVLEFIVKDLKNHQIADKLNISVRTVETHKQNMIMKTGTNSVAGLVVYAIKNNLIVTE